MSIPAGLESALGDFLGRQRWFSGDPAAAAESTIADWEWLVRDEPGLLWVLAEAAGTVYQVPVGLRRTEAADAILEGQENAVIGRVELGRGEAVAYDALVDPECCILLAASVLDLHASRARPVGAEQSNSSVVFDDRAIMKVFRRPMEGANPEVEVAVALDGVGFNHLPAPLGYWRRKDRDLAVAQEFLVGGAEGWAMALTSLRDLLATENIGSAVPFPAGPSGASPARHPTPGPPDDAALEESVERSVMEAGGDFGFEAVRLGEMTAKLHVAMARAFGSEPGRPGSWAEAVEVQLDRLAARADVAGLAVQPSEVRVRAAGFVRRLASLQHPGQVCRVHGDFHLGQVMRSEVGWFVLDFEGEPSRPLAERRVWTSPLKDVAGMVRSLHYASAVALTERGTSGKDTARLAAGWERRNRSAFMDGYLRTAASTTLAALLPGADDWDTVLAAFELEKAAYELVYELDSRPSWAHIPATALAALLDRIELDRIEPDRIEGDVPGVEGAG
ncbi:MAG: phosphotransferase [Actinomycetota bacterium]|nr:phosphotransferase [Actinomycetota bacterium]